MKPLISIITVVYNGEKHLEETILSVLNQTYDNSVNVHKRLQSKKQLKS
jgi:glycosyltransferase involved in cell wall biosynthesis